MYNTTNYAAATQKIQQKLDEYKALVNTGNATKAAHDAAKKAYGEAISEYNALVKSDAYEKLFLPKGEAKMGKLDNPAEYLKTVDPLGRAFKTYRFGGYARAVIKRVKDSDKIDRVSIAYDLDKNMEVFRLQELAEKWDELQKAAGVEKKVPLMASINWSTKVLEMRRRFRSEATVTSGYSANSQVYVDTVPRQYGDLTDEQKKTLDEKTGIGALKTLLQELQDAVYFDNTDRKNGSNKYRPVEKDVNWIIRNAHTFDPKIHTTKMMSEAVAYEIAFCVIAHVVTKVPYDQLVEDDE